MTSNCCRARSKSLPTIKTRRKRQTKWCEKTLLVFREVVPATGLEPVQCYLLEPESSASANSATRAS
jgi:hypothetical protein